MKKVVIVLLVVVMLFGMVGCGAEEPPVHQHTWKEATCETPPKCKECGVVSGESLGHEWSETTCTEASKCTRCNATAGKPLGHDVDEYTRVVEPTCSKEGADSGYCRRCEKHVYPVVPKTPHTRGEVVTIKTATLNEKGTRAVTCAVCGEKISSESYSVTLDEYKEQCETYTYEEISRYPGEYAGKSAKFTGEVIQVIESEKYNGDREYNLRVNVTLTDYGFYEDTIYVFYTAKKEDGRILEGDIVTMYGELAETVTYQSILGASITIPGYNVEHLVLN